MTGRVSLNYPPLGVLRRVKERQADDMDLKGYRDATRNDRSKNVWESLVT